MQKSRSEIKPFWLQERRNIGIIKSSSRLAAKSRRGEDNMSQEVLAVVAGEEITQAEFDAFL